MTTAAPAALAVYAAADCTALAGGSLQILDGAGAVLAGTPLGSPAGTSSGAVVTFSGFPKTAVGVAGTAASARLRTAAGVNYQTGLSVGIPGSGAEVIVNNGVGTLVITNGQNVTISVGPTMTHA